MKLPVYKLDINEWDEETGIEFVSLVESPAIQKDFLAFSAFENDYPQAAVDNAIRGMELNEKVDNDCATLVGKARANQLANRENLSLETIERTYSFLSRAKEYYNPDDTEACGTISYLLWGGEEMLRWCERILKVEGQKFAIQDEEKRIVTGAAMIADLPIYRRDDIRGEYYVVFDKESIFKIAKKWARGNKYDAVNTHHRTPIMDGVSLFESYIIINISGAAKPPLWEPMNNTCPEGGIFSQPSVLTRI